MAKRIVELTFEDGVFKPAEPLELAEGTRIQVALEPTDPSPGIRHPFHPSALREAALHPRRRIRLLGTALAMLGAVFLLVALAALLQRGIVAPPPGMATAVAAGRELTRAHLPALAAVTLVLTLAMAALWLAVRRRAGLVPAALTLAVGLALVAEALVLQGLFRPGALLAAGAAGALAAALWQSHGRLGTALEPTAWPWRREAATVLLILTVVFALRLHRIGDYPYGVEGDESGWAWLVTEAMNGPVIYPFTGMPTTLWLQGAAFRLFGTDIVTARAEVALLSVIGTALFYLAVRTMFNIPLALLATFLMGISIVDLAGSRQASVEAYVKIFGLLAVCALFLGYRYRRAWLFLVCGASLALGLMVYDSFVFVPVPLLVYAGYRLLRERSDWRRHGLYLLLMVLPMLLVTPRVWDHLEGRRIAQVAVVETETGINVDTPTRLAAALPALRPFMIKYAGITLKRLSYEMLGDVLLTRPGPMEGAALVPFLLLGLVIALWYWRRAGTLFVLLWLLIPALPTSLILGQASPRTFLPHWGAFMVLVAVGLWVPCAGVRADLAGRRRWLPIGLLGAFLAVVGLSNSYAYYHEVVDPDDRRSRRELGELLLAHLRPGEMVYLPYLPLRNDFLEYEVRYPSLVARGRVAREQEHTAYRHIAYPDLLAEIGARPELTGVTVLYDKVLPAPEARQVVLDTLTRCYPEHTVTTGRYFDAYHIAAPGLAAARCTTGAQVTPLQPVPGQTVAAGGPVRFAWRTSKGRQASFQLTVERHRDDVTWVEAENFSHDNGWDAQALLAPGFSGRGYLTDTRVSDDISAHDEVQVPQAGPTTVWARTYRRRDDHSPAFLTVAGRTLEVGRADPDYFNTWRWESLGPIELPAGPLDLALTRRFDPSASPWQILIDSVVLSRDPGFDPRTASNWQPLAGPGEVVSSRPELEWREPLAPGRYRWRVKVMDGDRLVGWDGRLGAASEDVEFQVAQ
jgi:4-amino-4-deoxy-L-arabinose transferase-like glycosyltransferase